ncbi:MAG: LPP20 family lipoprotein [Candidatus Poribacteria bacterium]
MQRFIGTSLIIALLGLIILWTGCGSGKQAGMTEIPVEKKAEGNILVPDWFLNPPEDPNYLYSPATATSKDLQLAIDTAKHQGQVDITQQLETKVSALFKRFREEAGVGEDSEMLALTTSASKAVVSETINGCKASKQDVKKEGAVYRAYVLMEMPIGEANAALMAKIKANKNMYTRFRATQAFDELNEEVEKYEQFKKEQGQ